MSANPSSSTDAAPPADNRPSWRPVAIRMGIFFGLLVVTTIVLYFLMIRMPGRSHAGPLAPLTDAERALSAELAQDVRVLAVDIGERNIETPAKLEEAAVFLEKAFAAAGFVTTAQAYKVEGVETRNIAVERTGTDPSLPIVIVGAHYDSVTGSPGGNDNGSGVAALLALARRFSKANPARTIRFVAFTNEEPPWFWTDDMGSLRAARESAAKGDRVRAMLSLETIGSYSDAPKSQAYPFPLNLAYPGVGNFVAFVGDRSAAALVRETLTIFRESTAFPSEGATLPGWLPGVGWSDHWGYSQVGYPAVMITDTAPFRDAAYHTKNDLPDQMDFDRMARVVAGVERVVARLAASAR